MSDYDSPIRTDVYKIPVPQKDKPALARGLTKAEYIEFHSAFCNRMVEITKAKNHDYTGDNPDPFTNFKLVEHLGVCNTEQGILTRMCDKMSRINSFVQKGEFKVKDESVLDTLIDLANYAAILAAFLKSKGERQ